MAAAQDPSSMSPLAPPSPALSPVSSTLLWCAGALGIMATAVAAVLPALIAIWQAQIGLNVSQSGLVAATELLAQVVGAGLFVWAARQRSFRSIAVVAVVGMIVGNLGSALSVDFASLMVTRAFAGLSAGVVRALCMMCLGRARNPGRAFAVYASAQVGLAASVTSLLPAFVARFGPRSPFFAIAVVSAIGLALCAWIPRVEVARSDVRRSWGAFPAPASLAIAGLFLYFLGQGAVWTYLEPIGRSRALPGESITRALALLNVAGLAGALGAGALVHRLNASMALLALLAAGLWSLAGIFGMVGTSPGAYTVSACGFYFAWCASFPVQFAVIAGADPTGRASAVTPAVDGLGLAAGATLAGSLLPVVGLGATGWIYASSSIAGIACYVVSERMRKNSVVAFPAVAGATALRET